MIVTASTKGYPFTWYLVQETDPLKNQEKVDNRAASPELIKSPEIPSIPHDTGPTQLERLLAEAAQAAKSQFCLSLALMVPNSPETSDKYGQKERPKAEILSRQTHQMWLGMTISHPVQTQTVAPIPT